MPKTNRTYYDLEVVLPDIEPKIWRRFYLNSNSTFYDLHMAIQDACGWSNSHLFSFRSTERAKDDIAGLPLEDDDFFGTSAPDARKVKLSSYFEKSGHKNCVYEYDFGDSWVHRITLKNQVALPEHFKRRLLDGARAFPLEDCGGVPGYYDCVKAAEKNKHPDLELDEESRELIEELLEWIGDWTPEDFDLEECKKDFDR